MTINQRILMRLSKGLLVMALSAAPLSSQTTLQTPNGTIELIGLQRWTVAMIEDSLAKYSPSDKLTVHACAAILQQKLHFASASVTTYKNFPEFGGRDYLAITLVEPHDSTRIHFKPALYDTLFAHAEWTEAAKAFRAHNAIAQRAFYTPTFFAPRLSPADSAQFASIQPIHDVIASNRTSAAFSRAVRMLDADPSIYNRTMAALILGNFVDRDSAWFALMDAQRDPIGPASSTASQVLSMLIRSSARPVDWRPAVTQLRYLIDGTNLFAFDETLAVLTATKIDPALAPDLLANGGTIMRAKLRSGNVVAKRAVVAFLSQLSGLPATSDAATFERWMDGLEKR
jgi:hypothetical protein